MNLDNLSHSDPYDRAVREDWELQQGLRPVRLGAALDLIDADDADAADTADDDDADANDANDAAANDVTANTPLLKEIDMNNGLTLIAFGGGWYGRSIIRVGWLRRVGGDEYELLNACSVIRTKAAIAGAIDRIAVEGPGNTHRTTPPSGAVELVHRLVPRRCWQGLNEAVWITHCPKPNGWVDESL